MHTLFALGRAVLLALLIASPIAPAFAAQADVALLQKYAGNWRGKGTLTGAESGSILCRLSFRPKGERLSYSGRCSAGAGAQSFTGTMAFNESTKRFEATSSGQTIAGKRSGGGVVFTTNTSTRRGTITSTMSLKGGTISFQFRMVNPKTKAVTEGSVGFSKS